MALTSDIHRPHQVWNEGGEKRGESDFLIWELTYPELFASYFISVALLSPVASWCPMRGEFILFIAYTTLASFRAGLSAGDESGCSILAVHWPDCAQHQASSSMKPQATWVEGVCRASRRSLWSWQSCANHSRINRIPAQEFRVRLCFPWFTCNTKGSKLPSGKALKAAEKARRWVGASFPPCPLTGDWELL